VLTLLVAVMAHAQQSIFVHWAQRTSPYYLPADVTGRSVQFAAGSCFYVVVARNGVIATGT
jgi:hypothetical protein